ncbi:MAG: phosphomannomutase/phosphoglucomutase [Pseudomonadota bacterium]
MASRKGNAKAQGTLATTGIWRHAVIALAIALLGIICAFGVLGWHFIGQAERAEQNHQQDRASSLGRFLNSRVAEIKRSLQAAGSSRFAADSVLQDDATRAEAAEQLRRMIPYAERVDLVPRGKAEVDLNADIPITFAALDVLKKAETAEFVGPEASLSQRNMLYAAVPITREGVVVGVLFSVLSNAALLAPLNVAFDESEGNASLIQQFTGSPATPVMTWGSGGSKDAVPSEAQLGVPHWTLNFTAAQTESDNGWTALLTPLALAIGLTLGGIGLGFSRLSKNLLSDADQLAEYGARLLGGGNPQLKPFNTPTFMRLARALASAARGDTAGAESAAAPAAPTRKKGKAAPAADTEVDEVAALLGDDDDALVLKKETPEGLDPSIAQRRAKPDDNYGVTVSEEAGPIDQGLELDAEMFRAYDIRGITTSNLTEDVVYWIGRAFAGECAEHGQRRVAIGRDGRLSSPVLADALSRGLNEGGMDVIDIGQVPTPLLYFATHALDTGTGIMITGSHNPPDYNGLKMMIGGTTLAQERITRLYERIVNNELGEGEGAIEEIDIVPAYMERVLDNVALAQSLKVVVDCGNGVAGDSAPQLIEELGCEVVPLYCEVDGTFPNHHPDPAEPHNLEDLKTVVEAEGADIGLAFDGDGDRLGVVTAKGEIIWPDKLMMLFSQDIVSRNPGADIIFDVKCSRHLNNAISEYGGRPIMWKTGHSHIKAKMKETGALLGGEFSGHICFGERWYGFDDALYSAARLLEILAAQTDTADEVFAQFPQTVSTPEIKITTTEREKFEIMAKLEQSADFGSGTVTSIDGIRVDFDDGWGLVRPSNTSPVLSLRFEADTPEALERVKAQFQEQLLAISPALTFEG